MQTVTSADGTRIAYWTGGAGRPLVLVHGTTADHSRWDPLLERLRVHVTTCAIDRRGRGGSGDHPNYAPEREYEDVAAAVDEQAARTRAPVDVFGHSFGALCALEASLRTKNVRRLVLYEPSLLADSAMTGFAEKADALLARGDREAVVELLFRDILGVPEADVVRLRAQPAWKVRVGAAHTLPREDRAEAAYRFEAARFRQLRTPTLLLAGDRSPAPLRRSTEAVLAALPNAKLAWLRGQEHMAISAAPDLIAEVVLPFLAAP